MRFRRFAATIPIIVLIFSSCSTIRHAETLDEDEHRVGLSVGGPLFDNLGLPIPMPNVSVDYQYGITDDFSAGGAVYITPIIFGLFGMVELDAALSLLRQNGLVPNLTVNGNIIIVTDFLDFRLYPQIGLIPSWRLAPEVLLYTGTVLFFDFFPSTEGIQDTSVVLPMFPLGVQLDLGQLSIVVELQYQMPLGSSLEKIIHFIGISDYGALAPYIGVNFSFGGDR